MQNECVLCAAHMQHVCLIHAGRLQICVQHTSNISVRAPPVMVVSLLKEQGDVAKSLDLRATKCMLKINA